MTIGQRIKKIRIFRGMTQKELGTMMGFGLNGDIRIAQYESGVRTPKSKCFSKWQMYFVYNLPFFLVGCVFLKMI